MTYTSVHDTKHERPINTDGTVHTIEYLIARPDAQANLEVSMTTPSSKFDPAKYLSTRVHGAVREIRGAEAAKIREWVKKRLELRQVGLKKADVAAE